MEGHRRSDSCLSRRELLRLVGGAAGTAMSAGLLGEAANALAAAGPGGPFRSRPDLEPPLPTVRGRGGSPGYVFVGPRPTPSNQTGPLIVDRSGELVWFRALGSGLWVTNFAVQRYRHTPVLVWWEGSVILPGYGIGEGVILDRRYRELARISAAAGRAIDLHELQLTPRGTALFTCHPAAVRADLSRFGGPRDALVLESIIQEVDIASGRLLFEWRSLDHVRLSESMLPLREPWDYLHVNSIAILPDGNLLVGARNTWALYKLDRRTGKIIWRLGGKRSDYSVDRAAQFRWQHDARVRADGAITLFDDGENADVKRLRSSQSRAIVLDVDEKRRRVQLARAYEHPHHSLLTGSMGSAQTLHNGHMLVGWGREPIVSEFSPTGELLADMYFPTDTETYRARHSTWNALPIQPPTLTANTRARTAYASWNGATNVAYWQLLTGSTPTDLRPAPPVRATGFETRLRTGRVRGYAAVRAIDHAGRRLGTSPAIAV